MKTLLILDEAPYGSERSYNGLRLAAALSRRGGQELRIFLMGDAVAVAHAHQKVPQGFYNLESMLTGRVATGASIGVCGSCMDARGLSADALVAGAHRGSMDELTDWTLAADKVLVF